MKRMLLLLLSAGLVAIPATVRAQEKAGTMPSEQPRFEESVDVHPTAPSSVPVTGSTNEYFLTFSAPFSVPGVTLKADTYVFRLPLGPGTNVVQVLTADRSEPLAMFQAIPTQDATRNVMSDGQVVLGAGRTHGAPLEIKDWYLPGQMYGYQFLYSNKAA